MDVHADGDKIYPKSKIPPELKRTLKSFGINENEFESDPAKSSPPQSAKRIKLNPSVEDDQVASNDEEVHMKPPITFESLTTTEHISATTTHSTTDDCPTHVEDIKQSTETAETTDIVGFSENEWRRQFYKTSKFSPRVKKEISRSLCALRKTRAYENANEMERIKMSIQKADEVVRRERIKLSFQKTEDVVRRAEDGNRVIPNHAKSNKHWRARVSKSVPHDTTIGEDAAAVERPKAPRMVTGVVSDLSKPFGGLEGIWADIEERFVYAREDYPESEGWF